MSTVTVVVPALNEAERLPVLLDILESGTRRPDAVVVADAGSTDATREVAEARGAQVVPGGKPAAGRNAGAAAATTDLVLFLDADDEPTATFLEGAIAEFEKRELAVASAHVEPIERDASDVFACEVVNLYLDLMQYVAPHAPGFCILIRREVHEAIQGFDETVVLAEDHDYVQRASEHGKFRILRSEPMRTSMRRIDKEGLVRLAFKYLYCEVYAVAGKPIHRVPFDYEFGAFEPEEPAVEVVDVSALRLFLGATADSIRSLSEDTLDRLKALGETEIGPERFERALRDLAPEDLRRLRRYLHVRYRFARLQPRRAVARVVRAGDAIWQQIGEARR